MIKTIVAQAILTNNQLEEKSNTFLDEYKILISENTDIYTENGDLLLKYRKNIIPDDMCNLLYRNLKGVATLQRGRAEATGRMEDKYSYIKSKSTGKLIHQLNSKARSGIVGYYDNKSFFGHKRAQATGDLCRQTAYTAKHMDKFQQCLETFSLVNNIYKQLLPNYYLIQENAINTLDSKYRIANTVFTTITVNKNFRTALHRDKGDFKEGFGILTVVSDTNNYTGMYTLFPKYGVAVDCRHGDFMAMNVHEWHCNTEKMGDGNRVSLVYYLRERMLTSCPR